MESRKVEIRSPFNVPQDKKKAPDGILNANNLFAKKNGRLNLVIGELYDDSGKLWVPEVVRESLVKAAMGDTSYQGPKGEAERLGHQPFIEGTARILFGQHADQLLDGQLAAAGTVGGTQALAKFADLMKELRPGDPVLISKQGWGNHKQIFQSRGIPVREYNHLKGQKYDMDSHISAIEGMPDRSVHLVHGGRTHNPTGVNPQSSEEWRTVVRAVKKRGGTILVDSAYAGIGDSLARDTQSIRVSLEEGVPVAVAYSNSKNAGLYGLARCAGLFIPEAREDALDVQRVNNFLIRVENSSPASIGEVAMGEIYGNPVLFERYNRELKKARKMLVQRRRAVAEGVPQLGFVADQKGLFSLAFSPEDATRLKEEYGIHALGDGRTNFGKLTPAEIPVFNQAAVEIFNSKNSGESR